MGAIQQLFLGKGGAAYTALGGFSDNFDDGSLNAWWQTSGSTISETGGVIAISGSTSAHIRSVSSYNLTGKTVRVQLGSDHTQSSHWSNGIILATSDAFSSYYYMDVLNSNVRVLRNGSSRASFAYNSTTMAYIQIRFISGTAYFETSPDGINWTTQYSEATGITITALFVYLRKFNDGFAAQTLKFDNFDSDL